MSTSRNNETSWPNSYQFLICATQSITALRPSKHNGTDRIRDSLSRFLSVQVKVAYREAKTGRDRILMPHLFESFDIPADEGMGGPVRFRVPAALVPVLANSSRWGRIKAEIVCAMSSKYAIALYELVQLRANMDRCLEPLPLARFRDLLGVPPGAYDRGCLIPGFDGALFTREWKDALWARFSTAAPQRQRQSVERYSIVKRA